MPVVQSCLNAALAYAARGWHVFPLHSMRGLCCSCGNPKCHVLPDGSIEGDPGKHPRTLHGFQDATTDVAIIRGWWDRWPDANIGIATGAVSGVDVLDVDNRHGGDESIEARFPGLEASVEALTGGGGRHLYSVHAPGVGSRAGILPGVDVRGDGGYVVAPPSTHASGRRYQWEVEHDPEEHAPTEAPPELVALMKAPGANGRAPAAPIPDVVRSGARNATLASLAGAMRRRGASEAVILAALRATPCDPPLDDSELQKIARSVARYAPDAMAAPPTDEELAAARAAEDAYLAATGEEPAAPPAPGAAAAGRCDSDAAPSTSPPATGGIPLAHRRHLTDLGNACRLVDRHGADIRWAPGLGWLAWTGTHWQEDATQEIARRAKETAVAFYADAARTAAAAAKAPDETEQRRLAGIAESLLKHAAKTQAAARVAAMIELARTEPEIATPLATFSERPDAEWLLNVANGTIDLRSGVLREHRRDDCLMKLAPTPYDRATKCPRWEQFLIEVFDADQATIGFIQRLFGYGLTASTRDQVVPIFWGAGANGKSTLINAISSILGPYAGAAAPDILVEDKYGSRHLTERADLLGMRVVFCSEFPEGARLNEQLLKLLSGGDKIKARKMRQDLFEFTATHKIIAATNSKPQVRGTDYAIWRRLLLVPFERRFAGRDADKLLGQKLALEAPGILRWMVRGCVAWQERGLDPPAAVVAATEEYRVESDAVGRWIADRCDAIPGARVAGSVLYADYSRWMRAEGEDADTETAFGRRLTDLGYPVCRATTGGRARGGLALRMAEEEQAAWF